MKFLFGTKKEKSFQFLASFKIARLIAVGFAIVIFIGSILLILPFASKMGQISYIDALFTATTSTCVTGLVTKTTAYDWSLFGQIVILLLIQIGGLGVVSTVTLVSLIMGAKISIKGRLILQKSFGLDSLGGVVKFIILVIKGTLLVELIGAIFYSFIFVHEFGWIKGIWISIFTSISAFCNAGIDIIGDESLHPYVSNLPINIITMILIILGGLGFPVWQDIKYSIIEVFKKNIHISKFFKRLNLHSKIVLFTTFILIFAGAFFIILFEWNASFYKLNIPSKILAGFFQAITFRTAGFYTVDQNLLSNATLIIALPLMLIGGSPAGCAGGVKTTTLVMLIMSARAAICEKKDVEIFKKRISYENVRNGITVLTIYFASLIFLSTLFFAIEKKIDFVDGIFETISAMATVGLSRGITDMLHIGGKIILIILMFLGRIGPITIALALRGSKINTTAIELPKEDVMIG